MMQIFSGASSGGWFEKAQRFGKSFMLPIAVLPAAGLLLGIGGALSNPNTLAAYPFLDVSWLQAIFTIMSSAGSIVFANLSVLFAVGVAVGLAKSDKGTAGLAALLAFLVMNATINALLILTGKLAHENPGAVGQGMTLGIQTLETGVFGGVVIGLVTCALHQRFNKIALPQFWAFWRLALCSYHQLAGGDTRRCAHDRGLAAFPEADFWSRRAGGCDRLSGHFAVRLHFTHAGSVRSAPHLLSAFLDHRAWRE